MSPKITIIIPVFNAEEFLPLCIESAMGQTLKDIEILCIDDGSVDKSIEVVRKYQEKDNRIRVLENDHDLGPSYTRNRGINEAKGKYVLFLDCDDHIDSDCAECLFEKAEENSLDFLRYNYQVDCRYKEDPPNTQVYGDYLTDRVYTGDDMFFTMVMDGSLLFKNFVCIHFCKTSFLRDNGLYFKEGIIYEDIEWVPRLFHAAERCMCLEEKKYRYVVRDGSITTTPPGQFHLYCKLFSYRERLKELESIKDPKWITAMNIYLAEHRNSIRITGQPQRGFVDVGTWEDDILLLYSCMFKDLFYVNYGCIYSIREDIKSAERIYIYGAGKAASQLLNILKRDRVLPKAFVVTSMDNNPEDIDGIPVKRLSSVLEDGKKALWLAAVKKGYPEIEKSLNECGYSNIINVAN